MFDPLVGRFLEEDPADFAPGDPNLYRYVGNSPTNATDPSGMWLFIDQEQVPYWAAIARATGVDIRVKRHPLGTLSPDYKNLLILDVPRTPQAHNAIWNALRMTGLDEKSIQEAVSALYGGNFNEAEAKAVSRDGGDLSRTGANVKITFQAPQIVGEYKDGLPGSSTGHPLGLTGEGGVWVAPGGRFEGGSIAIPGDTNPLTGQARSHLLPGGNRPSYIYVQPDPNDPTIIAIVGPQATITRDRVNTIIWTKQESYADHTKETNAIGQRPEEDPKLIGGLLDAADMISNLVLGGALLKGGLKITGKAFGLLVGGEQKAAVAAIKAELRGAASTNAPPAGRLGEDVVDSMLEGKFNGRIPEGPELVAWKKAMLERNGVDVGKVTPGSSVFSLDADQQAAFKVLADGRRVLVYGETATTYEFLHEWLHMIQFNKLANEHGFAKARELWRIMPRSEKEQFVYDRLRNHYWDKLNDSQKQNAKFQVESRGGRAWGE